ncbi:hypothetical protein [Gabonibacter chumensis]|uniref:hypothetical protein n=1 Tax=Gabonibacter chumensis TaxID=2972474 RepID=UPI002572E733|nr:hypothetical protein [Gabonibacter chumensis]MCR9012322.1 hypothetical protein [Gabonibacter chumensis]
MTKKHQFLSFLIGISLFSCNSAKHSIPSISNIDTDFPVTEKLAFKPFNTYDILVRGGCVIDDSILWHFERGKHDFGSCYNLNTGEKLSTIASRGEAANELIDLDKFEMIGDSVLLYVNRNTIKTFAKKDIIDNMPVGERKFSVTMAPDSVLVSQMIKLPNSSVLATIRPVLFHDIGKSNEINKKSVVIFNNGEANAYETITYDSFDVGKTEGRQLAANDLIKYAYAQGSIAVKNNDTVVFSVNDQFILYTFDLSSGNVINEKRYSKMQRGAGEEASFTTINDRHLRVGLIKLNDKYILCGVDGYFSEEDKNSGRRKKAIFVFDWDLNPIKKFDLPNRKKGYYSISNDCSSVYFCEYNEEGLTLYKADLTI